MRTAYRNGDEISLVDLGDIPAVDYRPDVAPDWQTGWDGVLTDTFFSGILVRYVEDFERVIVARFYC